MTKSRSLEAPRKNKRLCAGVQKKRENLKAFPRERDLRPCRKMCTHSAFFLQPKQKLLTREIPASDGVRSLFTERERPRQEAAFDMELLILRRPYG